MNFTTAASGTESTVILGLNQFICSIGSPGSYFSSDNISTLFCYANHYL